MTLRVAALQLPGCGMDLAANADIAVRFVREAAAAGAKLVALPELATMPYFCGGAPKAFRHWAEPAHGALAMRFAALSRELGITLFLPFFEYDETTGRYHNAVLGFGPDGRRLIEGVVARKLHLPKGEDPAPGYDEKAHFTAGEGLRVVAAAGIRIGVLVCYDRRFPEAWRALRAQEADLVVIPVAGSGGDDMAFFVGEMRTHARENGLAVLCANKVGDEAVTGGIVDNFGYSAVMQADGAVLALRPGEEGPGIVLADLDIGAIPGIRDRLRYFHDRRNDL